MLSLVSSGFLSTETSPTCSVRFKNLTGRPGHALKEDRAEKEVRACAACLSLPAAAGCRHVVPGAAPHGSRPALLEPALSISGKPSVATTAQHSFPGAAQCLRGTPGAVPACLGGWKVPEKWRQSWSCAVGCREGGGGAFLSTGKWMCFGGARRYPVGFGHQGLSPAS